jgi:hypothetical protein
MFNVNNSIHYSVILIIEELRLYLRHGIKNRWRVTPYITHRLRTLKLDHYIKAKEPNTNTDFNFHKRTVL